jgi:hypothetical protein
MKKGTIISIVAVVVVVLAILFLFGPLSSIFV